MRASSVVRAALALLVLPAASFAQGDGKKDPNEESLRRQLEKLNRDSGWADLRGDRIPEISANTWWNVTGAEPSRYRLRGQVWLLKFCSAKESENPDDTEELSALHDKFFHAGLRVIAITDSTTKRTKADFIDARKPRFWVGADPGLASFRRFTKGVVISDWHLPRYYLVDIRGRVIIQEKPAEPTIEKLLQAVVDPRLPGTLHAELDLARKAFDVRAFGVAHKLAARHLAATDKKLADDARILQQKVEQLAANRRIMLEADIKEGEVIESYAEALMLRYEFAGLRGFESWIVATVKSRAGRSEIKAEKDEWARFENALKLELQQHTSSFNRKKAKGLYEQIAKDNPDQHIAWLSKERAAKL